MTRLETEMEGLVYMSRTASSQSSVPPFKLISLFIFNIDFSPHFHISSKKPNLMWHEWHAILHLMAYIQSQEWIYSPPYRYRTKSSKQEEKKTRLLCAQDDGSHIFLLSCQQQCCTYHLPNDRDACSSQKSNGLFDHTTFLIYIWIRLWLHQMVYFSLSLSLSFSLPSFLSFWKRKAIRKARSENALTELESSDSF